jgi:hypothetical protein
LLKEKVAPSFDSQTAGRPKRTELLYSIVHVEVSCHGACHGHWQQQQQLGHRLEVEDRFCSIQ